MKRWNGWGDEATTSHLPEGAARFLEKTVGKGYTRPDATLAEVMKAVPASRLPDHALVSQEVEDRVRHARGQSLPDWVDMRSGKIAAFPDGVAYPQTDADVIALLKYAREHTVRLIPYGGGSSVTGHINPLAGPPTLTVDMGQMNTIEDLDDESLIATVGAGMSGPQLEQQLQARGYIFGHYPQSWELSTVGGWIATRSSGQQSYHYGRIEDNFLGGQMQTFDGLMEMPPLPASAAGPDLRQVVLGSEGRLGIITRAQLRIRRLPEAEKFYGVFFHSWEEGLVALRTAAQAGLPVSMLRLSNALETTSTLELSGKEQLANLANRGLGLVGYDAQRCLMLYGVTGSHRRVRWVRKEANAIFRRHGGFPAIELIGKIWEKSRFSSPYLRNTLWEAGYALDTFETALPWSEVQAYLPDALASVRKAGEDANVPLLIFGHLSHLYSDGASVYITYLFPRQATAAATLTHWQKLKAASIQTIITHRGTISHQHGVGVDHAPYLEAEKGAVGMKLLYGMQQTLDPQMLLNPGKLLPLK